jgi:hypothetical protein
MDQWRDSPQGRKKSGAGICLLLACLCLNFLSCSCNGEKTTNGSAADDSAATSCQSDADCPDGKKCNYNHECVEGYQPTGDDSITPSDDDSPLADDDSTQSPSDDEWPFAFDSYNDVPANVWEPRVGCEPPNIPLPLVKYPLPEKPIDLNDWPFNDPNITWLDYIDPPGSAIGYGKLVWTASRDTPQLSGSNETRCMYTITLDLATLKAYEVFCDANHSTATFVSPMTSEIFSMAIFTENKNGLFMATYAARPSTHCASFAAAPEPDEVFTPFPDTADGNWIFTFLAPLDDNVPSQYILSNISTGESFRPTLTRLSAFHFDMSGNYLAFIGMDRGSDNPPEDESLNHVYLYNIGSSPESMGRE